MRARRQTRFVGAPVTTRHHGDVIFAELDVHGHPHVVLTTIGDYDFSYSRQYGLLYGQYSVNVDYRDGVVVVRPLRGPGRLCGLWVAPGTLLAVECGDAPGYRVVGDAELSRMGYRRVRRARDYFEDARECEGGIAWCDVCGDYMPDEEECMCWHLWWSSECSAVIGPGSVESDSDRYLSKHVGDSVLACVEEWQEDNRWDVAGELLAAVQAGVTLRCSAWVRFIKNGRTRLLGMPDGDLALDGFRVLQALDRRTPAWRDFVAGVLRGDADNRLRREVGR